MSLITHYLDPALLERLNELQLSARRIVEGMTPGQHRSPVRGHSIEFRQHRAYVPGDEPRRLDWRVLARTDRPFVREYDEETNLRCALLLDCSGSMAYGKEANGAKGEGRGARKTQSKSKFEYAACVVASLAYLLLGQRESAGIGMFGKRLEQWIAPRAGTAQLAQIIDALERSDPHGDANIPAAMGELSARLERRSLAVVVSDFFCDVERLRLSLARLRHARHEIVLLRVLDDDEVEFPFSGWLRLNGMEGEGARTCEAAVVRQRYRQAFDAHEQRLRDACRAAQVELHTLPTSRPLGEALVSFLSHRAAVS